MIIRTIHHGGMISRDTAPDIASLPPTTYDTREPRHIRAALARGEMEHGWVTYRDTDTEWIGGAL